MRRTFFSSISILSLVWSLLITSAQAEGPDNVTFGMGGDDIHIVKATGPVDILITPDTNLDITQSVLGKRLATVSVTSAAEGRETQFALRLSPDDDNPTGKPDVGYIVDKSNENKIDVKLSPTGSHTTKTDLQGDQWLVSSINVSGTDKTKFKANLNISTNMPPSVGDYTVHIDAAEWNE